ncbi:MAG: Acylphosphatase [Synergistetes bacterium ADurb.BinA166]|jgi:acylphosphatase|nr:MAG: Acylphosphatase [Synergistetes bacterium ADurb.BinA166]
MAVVRRCFLIMGTVQGVGFRYFAAGAGLKLGLTGWVRNLPDGAVEVQAQGPVEAVDRMEQLLRKGPRTADVRRVTVIESPPREGESSFVVRHH